MANPKSRGAVGIHWGLGVASAAVRFRTLLLRTCLLGALAPATACTTTHLLRPLGRGNTRGNVSIGGGPMVRFAGAPIPMPVTTLGVAHGVTDGIDVHADVHTTAAFFGVAGLDMGAAFHPIASHRAALTVGASITGMSNGRDAVMFADVWFGTAWRVANFLWLGAGMHNGLRTFTSDDTLRGRSPWAPVPFVHVGIQPRGGRFGFEIELRWYAPTENGTIQFAPYYAVADRGALGIALGFNYEVPGSSR